MSRHSKWLSMFLAGVVAFALTVGVQAAFADDLTHAISGTVKSVDKGTKTFVVKAADGTEHTFKWTGDTVVKGTKDAGKGVAVGSEDTAKGVEDGAKVSVKYTEKAGEKTATGIKVASKKTADAMK
jgi:VCBS repeat-containing protein